MTCVMTIMGISTMLFFYCCFTLVIQPYSNKTKLRLQKVQLLNLSQLEKQMETDVLTMRVLRPIITLFGSALRVKDGTREDLQLRLERAGMHLTPGDYLVWKIVVAATVLLLGILFTVIGSKGFENYILTWVPMAILGFFVPSILVKTKIDAYEEMLRAEFPDFIDATRGYLCTGMSIFLTIKQVKEIAGPGLKPLLERLSAELEIYDQMTALKKFSRRVGIVEAQNFIVAVEQGISAGIPLKDILTNQSQLMRDIRKLNLKLKIRKKPVYLALVGGLLFINIFIIVGVPALVTIMSLRGINN